MHTYVYYCFLLYFLCILFFFFRSLILLISIHVCNSFITRLNERRHANFTITKDKKLIGIVAKTFGSTSMDECCLSCVCHTQCLFVNYKPTDAVCELLSSTLGEMVTDSDYIFLSTNYIESRNVSKSFKYISLSFFYFILFFYFIRCPTSYERAQSTRLHR